MVSPNKKKDIIKENRNQKFHNRAKSFGILETECLSHMASNGIPFSGPLIADGKIHRFSADEKKHKKDEWYLLCAGTSKKGNAYINGVFGSWSSGEKFSYRSWQEKDVFDEQELQELRGAVRKAREKAEKAIQERHEIAAQECLRTWESLQHNQPSETHLAYLKLKKVSAYGIRYGNNEQGYPSVIIPLLNVQGQIRSLQYISVGNEGTVYKRFHTEGEKKGNFFVMGTIKNGEPFYVCEGYVTGASAFEAINQPVVVAFDSGNLSPVIENLRNLYL